MIQGDINGETCLSEKFPWRIKVRDGLQKYPTSFRDIGKQKEENEACLQALEMLAKILVCCVNDNHQND